MATRTRPAAPPLRQRNALAPGILGSAALIAGIALIGGEFQIVIHFVVAILAIIIGWFAVQSAQTGGTPWWWAVPMAIIAVVWNPVFPFAFDQPVWLVAHIVGAAVFLAAGALIWMPRPAPARR